jgi:hypothetical protein
MAIKSKNGKITSREDLIINYAIRGYKQYFRDYPNNITKQEILYSVKKNSLRSDLRVFFGDYYYKQYKMSKKANKSSLKGCAIKEYHEALILNPNSKIALRRILQYGKYPEKSIADIYKKVGLERNNHELMNRAKDKYIQLLKKGKFKNQIINALFEIEVCKYQFKHDTSYNRLNCLFNLYKMLPKTREKENIRRQLIKEYECYFKTRKLARDYDLIYFENFSNYINLHRYKYEALLNFARVVQFWDPSMTYKALSSLKHLKGKDLKFRNDMLKKCEKQFNDIIVPSRIQLPEHWVRWPWEKELLKNVRGRPKS